VLLFLLLFFSTVKATVTPFLKWKILQTACAWELTCLHSVMSIAALNGYPHPRNKNTGIARM